MVAPEAVALCRGRDRGAADFRNVPSVRGEWVDDIMDAIVRPRALGARQGLWNGQCFRYGCSNTKK